MPEPDKILLITPDVNLDELKDYIEDKGPLPAGARLEDWETHTARGRVADCDCGLIYCECTRIRMHVEGCGLRTALLSPVTFPCEKHSEDFCLYCYCNCAKRLLIIQATEMIMEAAI